MDQLASCGISRDNVEINLTTSGGMSVKHPHFRIVDLALAEEGLPGVPAVGMENLQ